MKIYHSSKTFPPSFKKPIVTLGNFDGVHLAHQKMLHLATGQAKKIKGTAVAYTFDPHPVQILARESAPPMINTLPQKLELLGELGMDATIVEPFNLKFAHLEAKPWFKKVLVENLHAFGIIAGYDFTFGTHRSGTVETLEKLSKQYGLACRILDAQMLGETLISSTQIRTFLAHGDVDRANALLGRPYFVDGEVIAGAGRGIQLGIPTANLKIENEWILLPGVYASWAQLGKKRYRAVTNVGMNPTFGGETLTIETHLLHFKKNIYGKKIRLYFVKRIREERPFASVEELVKQIHADIEMTGKILGHFHIKWVKDKEI